MNTISDHNISDKKVLVRLDLDVPFNQNNQITDTTRLESALPTLNLLIQNAAQITIIGHLGRPDGKVADSLSLAPVAKKLSEILNQNISFVNQVLPASLPDSKIVMLENLRFDQREETNDHEFAKLLAAYADIFVFEAFAVSHRKAASTVGITQYLPSFAGLRVAQEVAQLSEILENTKHPFLVILGGAKIETKLPMIEKMQNIADMIFVGGKLPKEIQEKNLKFPENVRVASMDESGLDINRESIYAITEMINQAVLIVWNGPVGKFEDQSAQAGTKAIADAIINSNAKTITGGGDTVAALDLFGIKDKISFVSVGGGAMLEFLSGKPLPALQALE